MKKIFSLITLLVCIMMIGINSNVNADALGYEISCNGIINYGDTTRDLNPTFNGDVLACSIRAQGSIAYFKDLTLKYNFGEDFSFVKFVPNEKWTEVTKINDGVKLTSKDGIPTNISFGTLYVKVTAKYAGTTDFNVVLENSEFGETNSKHAVYVNSDNENRLESVVINDGKLPINFDSDVFEYNLSTTSDTANFKVKTKNTVSLTDVKDSYKLNYGKNVIKIKVTDYKADFNRVRVYTFNITRNDNRSDDNTLKKLVVCGNEIQLIKGQYDYSVNVGFDTEKAEIDYELNNDSAKSELKGDLNLAIGKNTYVIMVTSEKGNAQAYNISIIKKEKVLSTNNYLSNIEIKDHSINFNKDVYEYIVKLKNEKALDITVKTEDENADYQIVGNNNLKDGSVVYINVNSEAGSLRTYSITVDKAEAMPVQLIIICLLSVIVVVLVVLLIIFKRKYNVNKTVSNNNN